MEALNQDVYVAGQPVTMNTQDAMDTEDPPAAISGVSLASSEVHGPPCSQPSQGDGNMEESSIESPTVIPREP